jgi:hypothetical protein
MRVREQPVGAHGPSERLFGLREPLGGHQLLSGAKVLLRLEALMFGNDLRENRDASQ